MFSTSSSATPITVDNYSFEEPVLVENAYTYGAPVSGWFSTGDAGVWNPGDASYLSIPDGSNVAWVHEGYLYQTIGTLIAGHEYTLEVAVGKRDNYFNDTTTLWPGYAVELWDKDGNVLASESSLTLVDGSFSTSTVTYVATAATDGLEYQIRLYSGGVQVNFDNVRLDNTVVANNDLAPIPEPSTLILIGAGLLGLALVRRK
jgi:hypothetical protein